MRHGHHRCVGCENRGRPGRSGRPDLRYERWGNRCRGTRRRGAAAALERAAASAASRRGKRSAQRAQRTEARGIAAVIAASAASGDLSGEPGREATRPTPSSSLVSCSSASAPSAARSSAPSSQLALSPASAAPSMRQLRSVVRGKCTGFGAVADALMRSMVHRCVTRQRRATAIGARQRAGARASREARARMALPRQ